MGDANNGSENKNEDTNSASTRGHLDSFHPECNRSKQLYDECFRSWFANRYMTGKYRKKGDHEECQQLYKDYTDCVKRGMQEYGLQYEQIAVFHLNNDNKTKSKPKIN